jgi:uncharacterized membrane protein
MRVAPIALLLPFLAAACAPPPDPADGASKSRIRVLYVEGSPRWEYRYLAQALVRDSEVDAHVWLASAEPDFPQEHSRDSREPAFQRPLEALPESAEALLAYDVVILGDVAPDALPHELPALLREFVEVGGRGLVVIAGERMPRAWRDTALSAVLPAAALGGASESEATGYRVTEAGSASPILVPFEQWASLPRVSVRIAADPAPGAATLLEIDGERLVLTSSPGRGRVFLSATDETWRWRKDSGDRPVYGMFWKRVLGWAGS